MAISELIGIVHHVFTKGPVTISVRELQSMEEDITVGTLATIEADLGKVGHAFVMGAAKLKAVIIQAAGVVDKAEPEIATIEALANGVAEQIYPGAGVVATAIEAAMAKVFSALDAAGAAADANGLSLQLDSATVAAVKAALPTVKAQAQTTPGS